VREICIGPPIVHQVKKNRGIERAHQHNQQASLPPPIGIRAQRRARSADRSDLCGVAHDSSPNSPQHMRSAWRAQLSYAFCLLDCLLANALCQKPCLFAPKPGPSKPMPVKAMAWPGTRARRLVSGSAARTPSAKTVRSFPDISHESSNLGTNFLFLESSPQDGYHKLGKTFLFCAIGNRMEKPGRASSRRFFVFLWY